MTIKEKKEKLNKIIEEGKTTDELSGFSFQTEYFKAMKKTGNYGRSIRVQEVLWII